MVLQRCRGRGLYMVRGNATEIFLRETHTRCHGSSRRKGQDLLLSVYSCGVESFGWGGSLDGAVGNARGNKGSYLNRNHDFEGLFETKAQSLRDGQLEWVCLMKRCASLRHLVS